MTTTHLHPALPPARPQALPMGEPFALGAHLITPRCGYTHHGIYVGNGRVVHYAGWSRSAWTRRPVEEVSLTQFAGDCGIAVLRDSPTRFSPAEVVARARSRLGEDRYRVATNNCEHFCHWCLSGENRSAQVERLFGWAAAMASRVAAPLRLPAAGPRPRVTRALTTAPH